MLAKTFISFTLSFCLFLIHIKAINKSTLLEYPNKLVASVNDTIKDFPAFNKELLINIEGDFIAGYALIARGKLAKETVILIAGYPGNDTNFDTAQEIRRNGKNAILFRHRGAWGSQGTYTYSNCLEDIHKLVEYFSRAEIAKELRIDPNNFTLLGRSFGGGIALITGAQINAVKKIIALSSANYGSRMEKFNSLEELSAYKKYMQKQIMINTDIDAFLQELLDNKIAYNIVNYSEPLSKKMVLIIEDSKRNEHWINQLEKKEYVLLESDHNFVEERTKMIDLIVNWLEK
jgi:pimeloyl-ACP methyl ester carboxylesterase